ncbi:MAG TPA: ATP-binding protein, partial [Vicinamibacteria bacterium]
QKRAERELKLLYEEAEQANRAKDEFLAMLGHELRNPLGAMSNALYLIEQDQGEPAMTDLARAVLKRQVGNLVRLVDDLLDMGRLVTGKILLRKAPLDLSQSVSRVVAAMRTAGKLASHDVELAAEPAWIDVDEVRMEQIISNLVGNAAKYTPPGGSIRISVKAEKDSVVLEVEDNGIGIPEDLLPRVFDLFVQGARNLDRSEGGLGIGLSIVKRLAELHGGSISAFSAGPGRGSLFRVRLPAMVAPAAGREKKEPGDPAKANGERLKILVVEDNRDALETLKMLLSAKGHEVHGVASGKKALDEVSLLRPDVAIIDLGLPGMNGYEVAKELRNKERGEAMLLVALTGYGSLEHRKRTEKAGFDAHLLKPLDYNKLTALLRKRRGLKLLAMGDSNLGAKT